MADWVRINDKYFINTLGQIKSTLKQKDLSLLFGVNVPSISMIKNRKTWTHI